MFKLGAFTGLCVENQDSGTRIVFSVLRMALGQYVVQNLCPVLTSKEVVDWKQLNKSRKYTG